MPFVIQKWEVQTQQPSIIDICNCETSALSVLHKALEFSKSDHEIKVSKSNRFEVYKKNNSLCVYEITEFLESELNKLD